VQKSDVEKCVCGANGGERSASRARAGCRNAVPSQTQRQLRLPATVRRAKENKRMRERERERGRERGR
jgi:hypothetical protein